MDAVARRRFRSLPVAAALAALALPPAAGRADDRFVNVAMEDQYRNRRETGVHRGDMVVLVYADRKGAEAALELGRRLHVQFHPTAATAAPSEWARQPVTGLPGWPANVRVPDVHVIPVACLPEVPKPLEAVVRSRMRTDSPQVPVWLDFEGVMEQKFGVAPGCPNVAVIDTFGRACGVQNGHFDELEFRRLAATIDEIRMQAAPPVAPVRQAAAAAAPVR